MLVHVLLSAKALTSSIQAVVMESKVLPHFSSCTWRVLTCQLSLILSQSLAPEFVEFSCDTPSQSGQYCATVVSHCAKKAHTRIINESLCAEFCPGGDKDKPDLSTKGAELSEQIKHFTEQELRKFEGFVLVGKVEKTRQGTKGSGANNMEQASSKSSSRCVPSKFHGLY
jgi:hypothetical protein